MSNPIASDLSDALPHSIEPVVYFLQGYATPEILWKIRAAAIAAFLLLLAVYWYYKRKTTVSTPTEDVSS